VATRRQELLLFAACAFAAATGAFLADSYLSRLPQHRGYYLVPVADRVAVPVARPYHAVLAVVDGLRADRAAAMTSTRQLRAEGAVPPAYASHRVTTRPIGVKARRTRSGYGYKKCHRNEDVTAAHRVSGTLSRPLILPENFSLQSSATRSSGV
jgi:hypothetical protein